MARRKDEETKVTTLDEKAKVAEAETEEAIITTPAGADTEEEDYDPNEPVFIGGPTIAEIDAWKEQYGQVYLTEVDDDDLFIWHVINRKEFKEIMKIADADAMYREERICEKCVLWPAEYSFTSMESGKAGTPTVLAEQIMERSGFSTKTGPIPL